MNKELTIFYHGSSAIPVAIPLLLMSGITA